jgi:tripeptide aminopeptidase
MPELAIIAESRSLDEAKLDAQTKHMIDTFESAAKEFGAQIEVKTTRMYSPMNLDENEEIVEFTKRAFANLNIVGKPASTGGGSDTNVLNKNGIKSVNLGIGMKKAHTLDEYIAIEDIINSAKTVVEIIKEA